MKNIIVLGSGCSKCVKTAELIQKIADEMGILIELTKESSAVEMLKYGIMSTPAIVVDGQLVSSGSIPNREMIESYLQ